MRVTGIVKHFTEPKDVATKYGTKQVQNFKIITPERLEMTLQKWIKEPLSADLLGKMIDVDVEEKRNGEYTNYTVKGEITTLDGTISNSTASLDTSVAPATQSVVVDIAPLTREEFRAEAIESTRKDLAIAVELAKEFNLNEVDTTGIVALADRVGRTISALLTDRRKGN